MPAPAVNVSADLSLSLPCFAFLKYPTSDNISNKQGPDFDDMSSFFPCEIDDAIQYINLRCGVQAPKIVIL